MDIIVLWRIVAIKKYIFWEDGSKFDIYTSKKKGISPFLKAHSRA